MKIVFVILHYLAIDETYKSVDSIEKKIDTDMYKIVIVDNASPDKSGALLKEHYKNDDHVEVLLNQENLGFARGNNVGFRYAEKTWNPSYIVLMNNDVYLLDDDFLEKVEKEYKRSQFAVLGPMILSADGRCDINPIRTNAMSKQEVEHDIQAYKIDDYRCLKIYELCEENRLPILMHTGDSRYDYSNPNRLLPVL